ncbi:MAG: DUF4160 domain-containing protein [Paludibacteraceae bacterium]
MPKVLLYITARITWIFLFYGTDYYENRAHVHVGKRDTDKLCKIWLEPEISIADPGDLTPTQQKQILEIAADQRDNLMKQWRLFKTGKKIRLLTIKK